MSHDQLSAPPPTTGRATSQAIADDCIARLSPTHQGRVRAALSGADLQHLDVADVSDLCDRVAGLITFTEYQGRARARRRRTSAR